VILSYLPTTMYRKNYVPLRNDHRIFFPLYLPIRPTNSGGFFLPTPYSYPFTPLSIALEVANLPSFGLRTVPKQLSLPPFSFSFDPQVRIPFLTSHTYVPGPLLHCFSRISFSLRRDDKSPFRSISHFVSALVVGWPSSVWLTLESYPRDVCESLMFFFFQPFCFPGPERGSPSGPPLSRTPVPNYPVRPFRSPVASIPLRQVCCWSSFYTTPNEEIRFIFWSIRSSFILKIILHLTRAS